MTRFGFRKHQHLRLQRDFDRAFRSRCSVADQRLVVYVHANGLPHSRLGLSVSKRTGHAVKRNRIRRLLREAFRLNQHHLPGGLDIICIAKPIDTPMLESYQQSIDELVRRATAKMRRRAGRPSAGPTGL